MTSALDTIREQAATIEQARQELRDSVYLAHHCGERAADIASAAGVTRQRVYQVVAEMDVEVDRMRERIALIDKRYESLLDVLAAAEGRPGDYKRVTAIQNGQARKLARRGIVEKTVTRQLRDLAESKLLRVLEDRADEPIIRDVIAQLDEAAALRKRVTAFDEARAFGEVL